MRNMYARIYNQRTWFVELRLIFAPYEKSRARVPVPLPLCFVAYIYIYISISKMAMSHFDTPTSLI